MDYKDGTAGIRMVQGWCGIVHGVSEIVWGYYDLMTTAMGGQRMGIYGQQL